VVLHLSQKVHLRGKSGLEALDGLASQHGKYESIKTSKADLLRVLNYAMKDRDYLTHGVDLPDLLNRLKGSTEAKCGVWSAASSRLADGTTVEDLNAWNPGFVMLNLRKVEEYRTWLVRRKAAAPKTELLIRVGMEIPTSSGIQLLTWLNENVTLGKTHNRLPRQKQLWLWGAPGIGKTRLIDHLRAYLRVYVMPNDEDWNDHWEDDLYDLAVFDEFRGQRTIQFLNGWLDGQVINLKQKGRASYLKRFNVATIILSNYPPQQCYHKAFDKNASQLAPLIDRLTIIEWDSPSIDLEFISEGACSDYEKEECATGNWREYVDFLNGDVAPSSPLLD